MLDRFFFNDQDLLLKRPIALKVDKSLVQIRMDPWSLRKVWEKDVDDLDIIFQTSRCTACVLEN